MENPNARKPKSEIRAAEGRARLGDVFFDGIHRIYRIGTGNRLATTLFKAAARRRKRRKMMSDMLHEEFCKPVKGCGFWWLPEMARRDAEEVLSAKGQFKSDVRCPMSEV